MGKKKDHAPLRDFIKEERDLLDEGVLARRVIKASQDEWDRASRARDRKRGISSAVKIIQFSNHEIGSSEQ